MSSPMDAADPNGLSGASPLRDSVRFHLRKVQRHPVYLHASHIWRTIRETPTNAWRCATHGRRVLPSAIIVGAQKGGTTQLYEGLIRHPACFGSVKKELNYFSDLPHWPLWWYRSRFPLSTAVRRHGGICLEASPSYLPSPNALRRMHETLPNVKVIAILRDPVARAFSHYQHWKTRHRDARDFATATREIIAGGTLPPIHGAALATNVEPLTDYISRGYYALQIEALWQSYPHEQTLILDSADLFANTTTVCQRVFDFLGLPPHEVTMPKIYNRGYYREMIDPTTAEMLRGHFRPYDELLIRLTGQSFGWMESRSAVGSRRHDGKTADRAA
jgi:hypothetical protein